MRCVMNTAFHTNSVFIQRKLIEVLIQADKQWLVELPNLPSFLFIKLLRIIPEHIPDSLRPM